MNMCLLGVLGSLFTVESFAFGISQIEPVKRDDHLETSLRVEKGRSEISCP